WEDFHVIFILRSDAVHSDGRQTVAAVIIRPCTGERCNNMRIGDFRIQTYSAMDIDVKITAPRVGRGDVPVCVKRQRFVVTVMLHKALDATATPDNDMIGNAAGLLKENVISTLLYP